ncbi:MAG: nuclear transport factor 2 family protein [Actinomycetota bacterium]|nr:nuclear transport factor 2 family protein [Actinomycetota bacterium]
MWRGRDETHVDEDCGNAPKKATIRDLLLLAHAKYEKVLGYLTDDIQWERAGAGTVTGHGHLAALLSQLTDPRATALTITNILSHGDRCAASGTFSRADGSQLFIAHFFRFSGHGKNAKISKVITYILESHDSLPVASATAS